MARFGTRLRVRECRETLAGTRGDRRPQPILTCATQVAAARRQLWREPETAPWNRTSIDSHPDAE